VGHVRESDPRRPAASAALPLLLFGALGLAAAYGSRPLSGRVGTLAPFLAVAGVVMVVYWRWKGDVTAQGKKVQATGWRHAWALHGDLLWYGLPVWGAVLHAALLRTAPMEALVMLLAFGLGAAVMDVAARGPAGPVLRRLGDRAGWVGAAALLAGAAWNGLLYLR